MKQKLILPAGIIVACICSFIGGMAVQKYNTNADLRSYQIDLYNDSTVIWDGSRHVGTLPQDFSQRLDSLMIEDNK